tara:strand:- start:266 stop:439 length:174 start_codon:yes stop_codon:yes gene_type:complete
LGAIESILKKVRLTFGIGLVHRGGYRGELVVNVAEVYALAKTAINEREYGVDCSDNV